MLIFLFWKLHNNLLFIQSQHSLSHVLTEDVLRRPLLPGLHIILGAGLGLEGLLHALLEDLSTLKRTNKIHSTQCFSF